MARAEFESFIAWWSGLNLCHAVRGSQVIALGVMLRARLCLEAWGVVRGGDRYSRTGEGASGSGRVGGRGGGSAWVVLGRRGQSEGCDTRAMSTQETRDGTSLGGFVAATGVCRCGADVAFQRISAVAVFTGLEDTAALAGVWRGEEPSSGGTQSFHRRRRGSGATKCYGAHGDGFRRYAA